MTTQIHTKAITNNGITVFTNSETVIATIGEYSILIALDASNQDEQGNPIFKASEFIIYAQSNADPIYLGFAYFDMNNNASIDLSDGEVENHFNHDEIVELVQEQLELAKQYQDYQSPTMFIETDNGSLSVVPTQEIYPDNHPDNTDTCTFLRAVCITPTGRKLNAFWFRNLLDDDGNPIDDWGNIDFDCVDDYQWL